MKTLIACIVLVSAVFLISGCKKSDNNLTANEPVYTGPQNGWILDTAQIVNHGSSVAYVPSNFVRFTAVANPSLYYYLQINIYSQGPSVTPGTYRIGDYKVPGQITIYTGKSMNQYSVSYESSPVETAKATIQIKDGKTRIYVPEIWIHKKYPLNSSDS